MSTVGQQPAMTTVTSCVDEGGDGVLFGPKGRDRLADADAQQSFMLGMVRCVSEEGVVRQLARRET